MFDNEINDLLSASAGARETELNSQTPLQSSSSELVYSPLRDDLGHPASAAFDNAASTNSSTAVQPAYSGGQTPLSSDSPSSMTDSGDVESDNLSDSLKKRWRLMESIQQKINGASYLNWDRDYFSCLDDGDGINEFLWKVTFGRAIDYYEIINTLKQHYNSIQTELQKSLTDLSHSLLSNNNLAILFDVLINIEYSDSSVINNLSAVKQHLYSCLLFQLESLKPIDDKLHLIDQALNPKKTLYKVFCHQRSISGHYIVGFFKISRTVDNILRLRENILQMKTHTCKFENIHLEPAHH